MPAVGRTLSAGIVAYVLLVLLWGYFVAQQLLLAVLVALLGVLVAGLASVAWQYVGGSGGSDGGNPET